MILLLCLFFLSASATNASNPFTSKPEKQQGISKPDTLKPLIKNEFFVKIIFWQKQLREKMSHLIREVRTKKSLVPFFILFASAFAYGVIHSAGPGHGKAVALSYILSCKPNLLQSLIFSNLVALTHGLSGIFFVLIVKYLLQASIPTSLEAMTNITQVISYSLITCLGLIILVKGFYKCFKTKTIHHKSHTKYFVNPFITAVAIGIIPCPGVVMVMLFAMSMNLTWLGILLGTAISFGMATTITLIAIIGISGKIGVLSLASNNSRILTTLGYMFEAAAGLLMVCFGFVLLITSSTF